MSAIRLKLLNSHPKGTVRLPASKSISNRLLVLQALFPEFIHVNQVSEADDTRIMFESLHRTSATIDVGNAGTCLRFLTAFFACSANEVILTGLPRLHQRPIAPLVNALRSLGAKITYLNENGYAPLHIEGSNLKGGEVIVSGAESSQFISALMLIAPTLPEGIDILIEGQAISVPYIHMTATLLRLCGLQCDYSGNHVRIPFGQPAMTEINVEADWSAASYWYTVAALSGKYDLGLEGLINSGIQGDESIVEYMRYLGIQTVRKQGGVRLQAAEVASECAALNLSHEPDLVPAIAVAFAGCKRNLRITGIASLKAKESDRIETIADGLRRCGFQINTGKDELIIEAEDWVLPSQLPIIETYGDHRIAMAFAPLVYVIGEIVINDPEVVNKSYPDFWNQLASLGISISPINS